jgi:serine/threonine protein kinase
VDFLPLDLTDIPLNVMDNDKSSISDVLNKSRALVMITPRYKFTLQQLMRYRMKSVDSHHPLAMSTSSSLPKIISDQHDQYHQQEYFGMWNESEIYTIFTQLCRGLHHLHEHKIVHCNIKPETIWINVSFQSSLPADISNLPELVLIILAYVPSQLEVVLSSFGASIDLTKSSNTISHTIPHTTSEAPKQRISKEEKVIVIDYGKQDAYDLGCIIYCMMTTLPYTNLPSDNLNLLFADHLFVRHYSWMLRALVATLLQPDPMNRLTSKETMHILQQTATFNQCLTCRHSHHPTKPNTNNNNNNNTNNPKLTPLSSHCRDCSKSFGYLFKHREQCHFCLVYLCSKCIHVRPLPQLIKCCSACLLLNRVAH